MIIKTIGVAKDRSDWLLVLYIIVSTCVYNIEIHFPINRRTILVQAVQHYNSTFQRKPKPE